MMNETTNSKHHPARGWTRRHAIVSMCSAVLLAGGALLTTTAIQAAQGADSLAKAEIGKPAPDFTLTDLEGNEFKLSDHKGKIVVLEWFNPDCPFVVAQHKTGPLTDQGNEIDEKEDMVWVAINSGAPGKQGAGKDHNTKMAETYEMNYPVLLDESGEVGRSYGAKTTPHMYVIDEEGILRYEGAIDDDPMGKNAKSGKVVTNYVTDAIAALEADTAVTTERTRPYGCSVKYGKKPRKDSQGGGPGN